MNTQYENFAAPLKEINELTVKNFETVADLQIRAAEENVKAGIEQVKNASSIRDAETWKTYLDSQAAVTQQFNERLVANARTVVELGNAYTVELQRIVKDAFSVK